MKNRKERRIAAKHGLDQHHAPSIADLMDEARRKFQKGNGTRAEVLCREILARLPTHVDSLNLIGVVAQSSGRHKLSVQMFNRAIASDPLNAARHYNLASSYQVLNQRDLAVIHFKKAITLGLSGNNVEEFIMRSLSIAAHLDQLEKEQLLPRKPDFLDVAALKTVADDLFLRCAIESTVIRGQALEMFLARLRLTLLRFAAMNATAPPAVMEAVTACLSALAQQCFINEYLYPQGEDETRQSINLRDFLLKQLDTEGGEIEPITLAAVAAYFPLYQLPEPERILSRQWPVIISGLIRQQLHEPLEELRDRPTIPALTAIDDGMSREVMQQYEENPYPRRVVDTSARYSTEASEPFSGEILIAGCGTGFHVSQVAHRYPNARILAIDISLPSLAYARRKIREAGLRNVDCVQADILKLGTIGRKFDRIEAVGVLHHLTEPETGWSILLSLLRPGGQMRVGLYSQAARRSVMKARALFAERGYRPTVDDIRECRQEIFRTNDGRWKNIISTVDFYSVSGVRDLLFHVIEHRFTITQISEFLVKHGLSFLGFEVEPQVFQLFERQFSRAAMTDIQQWLAFEKANPLAVSRYMYVFSCRKET
jgi:SAM-dependent methyltransferase